MRAAAAGPLNLNFFCHALPEAVDDSAWRALLRPYFAELGIEEPDPTTVAPASTLAEWDLPAQLSPCYLSLDG